MEEGAGVFWGEAGNVFSQGSVVSPYSVWVWGHPGGDVVGMPGAAASPPVPQPVLPPTAPPRKRGGHGGHDCPDPAGERGRECQHRSRHGASLHPQSPPNPLPPRKAEQGGMMLGIPVGCRDGEGSWEKLLLILNGEWDPPPAPPNLSPAPCYYPRPPPPA